MIDDVYEIRLFSQLADQVAVNTWYYEIAAEAGTGASTEDIASAVDAAAHVNYKDLLTQDARYLGLTAQKIWPLPVTISSVKTTNAGFGTAPFDAIDTGACGVLKKITPLAGPRFRGRAFVPFPAKNFVLPGGVPSTLYTDLLAAHGNDMFGPITAGGGGNTADLRLVLYHRDLHTTTAISDFTPVKGFGQQHRRSFYGKQNPAPF